VVAWTQDLAVLRYGLTFSLANLIAFEVFIRTWVSN
jgi:hypothetical protein